jgi:hypothetical protein
VTKPRDTSSEEWRHECEVRWCAAKGYEWCVAYCKGVADKRGRPAAERLWNDIRAAATQDRKAA